MGDKNHGKDYTPLLEYLDICSVHAGYASRKLISGTMADPKKTLWLFNSGKDRFSFGFYNWRMESKGRWEWHWRWQEPESNAYNNFEWYNPFTSLDALAPAAPPGEYEGATLFKSDLLRVSAGIMDYKYLYTLENCIKKSSNTAALEAQYFLDGLKRTIGLFPKLKGIPTADEGALLGKGMDTSLNKMTPLWRKKIVEFIARLKN